MSAAYSRTVAIIISISFRSEERIQAIIGVEKNMHADGVLLSTDLNIPQAIPYFLWDEPLTVAEFRLRLHTASLPEQNRLLAKLLREARDTDVWLFVSPTEVWRRWPALAPQLGRRRGFWEFLFGHWQREGLLG
jgi:hypothetical protein